MLEHSGESLFWTRWFVHSDFDRRPVCMWLMRNRFQPQLRSLLTGNRFGLLESTVWRTGLIRCHHGDRNHHDKQGHRALSGS